MKRKNKIESTVNDLDTCRVLCWILLFPFLLLPLLWSGPLTTPALQPTVLVVVGWWRVNHVDSWLCKVVVVMALGMVMWVVVGWVVMTSEPKEPILHWTRSLTCTLNLKSWYVIAGTLLVLPTHSTNYFIYLITCINFGLRRPFCCKQHLKNYCCSFA